MTGKANEEMTETLEADCLVIGGGAMDLAFADVLVTESDEQKKNLVCTAAQDAAYAEAMMPVAVRAVENLQALLAALSEN